MSARDDFEKAATRALQAEARVSELASLLQTAKDACDDWKRQFFRESERASFLEHENVQLRATLELIAKADSSYGWPPEMAQIALRSTHGTSVSAPKTDIPAPIGQSAQDYIEPIDPRCCDICARAAASRAPQADSPCKHLQAGDCPSCYQEQEESGYHGRSAAEYMRDNPPDWHEKPKPEDETEETTQAGGKDD